MHQAYSMTHKIKWIVCVLLISLNLLQAQSFVNKSNNAYGAKCYFKMDANKGGIVYDDTLCGSVYIGLGGYYTDFTGPTSTSSGGGGYLSLTSKNFIKWFYIGSDGMFGLGNYKLQSFLNTSRPIVEDLGYFVLLNLNLVGIDFDKFFGIPLLFYMNVAVDFQDFTIHKYGQGFLYGSGFLGFGAFSRIMLTERFGLDFQLNLSYNFIRSYQSYGIKHKVEGFDGSYKLEAVIGMVWKDYEILPTERKRRIPDFYARMKGIYYDMSPMNVAYFGDTRLFNGQTIHSPKTQNFMLMFEVGLGY